MDGAGALDLGTLNMSEFAAGGTGHNEHHGDCRNPWDTERSTGGSSSGSGCAVAARMVFGALGSDTGGSVRMPAALCGVTGLKPTDGRVSRFGVMPRSWTSDTLGPMARSVRDVARLLGVIAGHDPRDPATRQVPVPDYEAEIENGVDGLRVGLPRRGWLEHAGAEVQDVVEDVRRCLENLGCRVGTVDAPDPTPAFDLSEIIVKSESASLHERWLRERPGTTRSQSGRRSRPVYISRRPTTCMRCACEAPRSKHFTARCSPTSTYCAVPFAAPLLADCDPNSTTGAARTMAEFPRFTRPISYLGLPALVLPGGFSDTNVPIGFQLVGAPFEESLLLRLGHRYQQATDWHRRRPSIG